MFDPLCIIKIIGLLLPLALQYAFLSHNSFPNLQIEKSLELKCGYAEAMLIFERPFESSRAGRHRAREKNVCALRRQCWYIIFSSNFLAESEKQTNVSN